MDIEKLHTAIAAMGRALEEKVQQVHKPAGPPKPPGQVCIWESGIFYFAISLHMNLQSQLLTGLLRKTYYQIVSVLKNLHLLLTAQVAVYMPHLVLIDTMKGSAIPIKTVGLGMIASCGLLTFMAGD